MGFGSVSAGSPNIAGDGYEAFTAALYQDPLCIALQLWSHCTIRDVPFLFSCYTQLTPPAASRPSFPSSPRGRVERGRRPSRRRQCQKRELSKAVMDRLWQHQVALPAYRCLGHNYLSALGMTPGGDNLFDPLKCDPLMLLDRKRVFGRLQDDTWALIV